MQFRRAFAPILIAASLIITAFAADGNRVFTITVASPTPVKSVQVRYFLGGEFGSAFSTSTATGNQDQIVINTENQGKPATIFKAIAYAPGCEFVTFAVDDLSTGNRQGQFECQKLPTTLLQGQVSPAAVEGKDLHVQVLYVCNWAARFFNIGPGAFSPFWVASAPVATDGTFSIELPDFASDPLWSTFSKDAFLSFHLVDAATRQPVAGLAPPSNLAQGELLRVSGSYDGVIPFSVQAPGKTK